MTKDTFYTSDSGFGYNLKVIQYGNGSAQIRLYDEPLSISERQREDRDLKMEREPFNGSLVRVIENFPSPIDPLESRKNSLLRTRRLIAEYARSICWEWFCTFTFSPDKADRTNYKKCCKQMRAWLKNTRDRKAENLQYLAVPELHKDMESWHFHVLLANTGGLLFNDSGIIQNGKRVYNVPGWTLGFSTATGVQDTYRVQKYIIKYMTKECHRLSRGEHRYFVSHKLPKPKKSIYTVEKGEEMNMIRDIADSLKSEVVYISHTRPDSYVRVTYIDLEPNLQENEGG